MRSVEPLPATTIIVIRNFKGVKNNIEVLMTKRHDSLKFLGGFYVFPGGKIEKQDYSDESISRLKGINLVKAHQILNLNVLNLKNKDVKNILLGYWIAGIRELFEEIGILLVEDETGKILNNLDEIKFNKYRSKIINNKLLMSEMMEKENLYYSSNNLIYYNRFVTPKFSPKRFDTRFFICKLPEGQEKSIIPHEKEISKIIWIKPQDALKKCKTSEDFKLIFPQIVSLKDLNAFDYTSLK